MLKKCKFLLKLLVRSSSLVRNFYLLNSQTLKIKNSSLQKLLTTDTRAWLWKGPFKDWVSPIVDMITAYMLFFFNVILIFYIIILGCKPLYMSEKSAEIIFEWKVLGYGHFFFLTFFLSWEGWISSDVLKWEHQIICTSIICPGWITFLLLIAYTLICICRSAGRPIVAKQAVFCSFRYICNHSPICHGSVMPFMFLDSPDDWKFCGVYLHKKEGFYRTVFRRNILNLALSVLISLTS